MGRAIFLERHEPQVQGEEVRGEQPVARRSRGDHAVLTPALAVPGGSEKRLQRCRYVWFVVVVEVAVIVFSSPPWLLLILMLTPMLMLPVAVKLV